MRYVKGNVIFGIVHVFEQPTNFISIEKNARKILSKYISIIKNKAKIPMHNKAREILSTFE
ncbi:hypothetical protein [Niallia sp. NCCP-28]|uniref:hypothetical protein n=1 Tax=Niallia sp. NCCP-28 TaxID=2934712 RepID=UPI00208D4965|nr:hypothetical protein [Niallia sp. NCCP-28]GKU83927.1 hypothetical protein NCCP28_33230 [Niallia sp. NCCP-28]